MPTVYALCPDLNTPFGGILKLYQLVDTLNFNGVNSFIVHSSSNFKIDWFRHSTQTTSYQYLNCTYDDLLIIPETLINQTYNYLPGIRKIIFNQNSFYTLLPFNWDIELAKKVYQHKDIVEVIVVSDYDCNFLDWLFPGLKLSKVTLGIDENLFYYQSNKKKQIAVMPRKLTNDYNFLIQLLLLKDELKGYSIKVIDSVSRKECAKILRESKIFLSFSHQDGFGLPPAEAMACGCIVIGYHGQGGKEFFREDLTYTIEPSDLISYAKCIRHVIEQFRLYPDQTKQVGKNASEFILGKYSMVNQEKSILGIIRPYVG